MALDSNMLKNRAQGFLAGFSAGQRMVILIAVVTLGAGGVFFAQWASKPTMVPLFSNLSPDDASQITSKLQSSHVQYTLTDGGQTIMVPQAKVYQTRLDMAGQGLPNGGASGYSLLDKQGITTSDFIQHVDYQRALEGELAKTIGAIDGVEAASVHLVIPQQDVFANDAQKPTASVLIKTAPGKSLSGQQTQAVVNLVASAVEGLNPTDVTVADDKGRVLASPGQGINGTDDEQTQATQSLQDQLTSKIQDMLTPLVGQGHAVVQARAELNWDKSQTTAEIFNPDNKPLQPTSQRSTTETWTNGSPNTAGCLGAGTPANGVCTPAAGTSGSGNYSKTDSAQDNATDHTVTQTEKAPGSINRVTVAVLLDSNVPNIDTTQIESLVTQAAGLQPARGDAVTVSRMPFDKTAADAAKKDLQASAKAKSSAQTMNLIKTVLTFLIIMVVLAVLFITTKRSANSYTSTPISMAELDAAMPALPSADDLMAYDAAPAIDVNSPEAIERAKVDKEITDLIEKQPDEVASLLRSWLADRRG